MATVASLYRATLPHGTWQCFDLPWGVPGPPAHHHPPANWPTKCRDEGQEDLPAASTAISHSQLGHLLLKKWMAQLQGMQSRGYWLQLPPPLQAKRFYQSGQLHFQ